MTSHANATLQVQVRVNGVPHTLAAPAVLADALALAGVAPPFAVAVNRVFVPRSAYRTHALAGGDQVEAIRPVTGG
jgi:sulfur carrier protein